MKSIEKKLIHYEGDDNCLSIKRENLLFLLHQHM